MTIAEPNTSLQQGDYLSCMTSEYIKNMKCFVSSFLILSPEKIDF